MTTEPLSCQFCLTALSGRGSWGNPSTLSFTEQARCLYISNKCCRADSLIPCMFQMRSLSIIGFCTNKAQCADICYKQIMCSSLIPYWKKWEKGTNCIGRKSSWVLPKSCQKSFFEALDSICSFTWLSLTDIINSFFPYLILTLQGACYIF